MNTLIRTFLKYFLVIYLKLSHCFVIALQIIYRKHTTSDCFICPFNSIEELSSKEYTLVIEYEEQSTTNVKEWCRRYNISYVGFTISTQQIQFTGTVCLK